jgi:hypothetical protein
VSQPVQEPAFLGDQRAKQLAWGFCIAFLLVVALVGAENLAHVRRDRVEEVTGVGDSHFFHPPSVSVGEVVASVAGRSLVLAEQREVARADVAMRRVGTDKNTALCVYQSSDKSDRAGTYYLKLSPGVYLKVHLSR